MLSKNHKEIEMMERVCIVGFDTYHTVVLEGISLYICSYVKNYRERLIRILTDPFVSDQKK